MYRTSEQKSVGSVVPGSTLGPHPLNLDCFDGEKSGFTPTTFFEIFNELLSTTWVSHRHVSYKGQLHRLLMTHITVLKFSAGSKLEPVTL